jgi:ABC-type branched-subunit amino acid transport system substrate-binding protein
MRKLPSPRAFVRGFLLVLPLLTVALIPFGCNLGTAPEPHRIGHLAPRSGPGAAAGIRHGEAIAMVVEEINNNPQNRIDGRGFTVIHADTGPELSGFTFQATRLIAINRVEALLGATNTWELAKCKEPVQANEMAIVSASSPLVDVPSKLIWAVGLPPALRGKWLASYATSAMKVTDVVMVTDKSSATFSAIENGFKTEFRHADRRIHNEWGFTKTEEAVELATNVAKAEPKAILFCGRAADLLKFRSALRAANLPDSKPLLFGGEEEEPLLRQDPQNSEGIVYVSAFTALDNSERVKAFCTDFERRCGQLPEATDALSADAARVLLLAAIKGKSLSAGKAVNSPIQANIVKTEIELTTGPFSFTDDGQARRTAYVLQIESGRPKLLKSFPAEKQ